MLLIEIFYDLISYFQYAISYVTQFLGILLLCKFGINIVLFVLFWFTKNPHLYRLKIILFGLDLVVVGVICLAHYVGALVFVFESVLHGNCTYILYAICCASTIMRAYEAWNFIYDPVFLVALLCYAIICFLAITQFALPGPHYLLNFADCAISMDQPALLPYSLIFTLMCGLLITYDPYEVRFFLIRVGGRLTWFTWLASANSGVVMVQTLSALIFVSLNTLKLSNGIQNGLSPLYVTALLFLYAIAMFVQVSIALRSIALHHESHNIDTFPIPFWYITLIYKLKCYNYHFLKQAIANQKGSAPSIQTAIFMLVFASSNVCFILI